MLLDNYKPTWDLIPSHCREGLELYLEHGVPVGSFLEAVLCNDLREAVGRADEPNTRALPNYIKFLYGFAPAGSWGSPQNYAEWIKQGGLQGLAKETA